MQAFDFINTGILIALAAALIWAAGTDIKYRRISNNLSLVIVALFAAFTVVALFKGAEWKPTLLWPVITGGIVFAVGAGLFALGLMGGGDVKMMAAVALFAGPSLGLSFILYVTLVGGLVALATLIHAKIQRADASKAKVPYGVAITFGGLWVCFQRFSTLSA